MWGEDLYKLKKVSLIKVKGDQEKLQVNEDMSQDSTQWCRWIHVANLT